MKPKLLLCLALVLSGCLFGCSTTRKPNPPSVEQVVKWAGFPESFKLNMASKPVTNTEAVFGRPVWDCQYENAAQSLTSFEIMFFEPGKLFGVKRTMWSKLVEDAVVNKRMNGASESLLKNPFQIVVLPNGCKAYFTVLGITHGGGTLMGFCYERKYDLLVLEDFAEDDRLPEKQMKQPATATNDLRVVFEKVKTFLDAQ